MENQDAKVKKTNQGKTTKNTVSTKAKQSETVLATTVAENDTIAANPELESREIVISKATKGSKVVLTDDLLVLVKNVAPGSLVYVTKSDVTYEWEKRNAVLELTLGELREIKNHKPKFFNNGWIAIVGVGAGQDSTATPREICSALGLSRFYEDSTTLFNIDNFLSLDIALIEKRVKTMSSSARENIILSIIEEIKTERLDSRVKIRALQDIFECKFEIDDE